MRIVLGMRNFDPDYRIGADSLEELRDGMERAMKALNRAGAKHYRAKINMTSLVNALAMWYVTQPIAEQVAIAQKGLDDLVKLREATQRPLGDIRLGGIPLDLDAEGVADSHHAALKVKRGPRGK